MSLNRWCIPVGCNPLTLGSAVSRHWLSGVKMTVGRYYDLSFQIKRIDSACVEQKLVCQIFTSSSTTCEISSLMIWMSLLLVMQDRLVQPVVWCASTKSQQEFKAPQSPNSDHSPKTLQDKAGDFLYFSYRQQTNQQLVDANEYCVCVCIWILMYLIPL